MRNLNVVPFLSCCAAVSVPTCVVAQVPLDRSDPTITQQALPNVADQPLRNDVPLSVIDASRPPKAPSFSAVTPIAIVITGGKDIPAIAFKDVIVAYVGRALSNADLVHLAGDIGQVARQRGYPFATASIAPQAMVDGLLKVRLDEGQIDAVRVIGAVNSAADRLLTKALATGRPTRQSNLERAILLVGDLPGVRVKESRFVRQDGFGILLVTVEQERASAYILVDNRGSKEVGPLRSTMLASIRTVAVPGDEFGMIASSTPLQPSEFFFLRGRYTAPVDVDGGTLSVSGAYGRSHPGASLEPLNVIGNSVDFGLSYRRSLQRSRAHSYSLNIELRSLRVRQRLSGRAIRDDQLTMLTGSLDGVNQMMGGVLRTQFSMTGGLPLPGASHEGDPMLSRLDGDARFVLVDYNIEWTRPLWKRLSLMAASSGQLASRPLLATAEIGAGGPGFGRAYDYAERTGDQGILGLLEMRYDVGQIIPNFIDRLQFYSSIDGGYVDNLRGGLGGGALLSSSMGARLGTGRFDGMIEISLPLNADRFDTQNRDPRVAVRLARAF